METDDNFRPFWKPDPGLSTPTYESVTVGRKTSPCGLPFNTRAHSSQHHTEPGNFRGFSCHVLLCGTLGFQPEASNVSPYAKDRAKQISPVPLLNFTENILCKTTQRAFSTAYFTMHILWKQLYNEDKNNKILPSSLTHPTLLICVLLSTFHPNRSTATVMCMFLSRM